MATEEELHEITDRIEAWSLVDELGEHSRRLMLAAQAASQHLGLPEEEPDDERRTR